METTPLKEYVAQSLAQGMRPEEVRAALISQGWTGPDIDQALAAPATPLAPIGGTVEGRPKRKIAIAVIVAVLILGAGGAFAYLKLFGMTAEERAEQAFGRLAAARTVAFDFTASFKADPREAGTAAQSVAMIAGPLLNDDGEADLDVSGRFMGVFTDGQDPRLALTLKMQKRDVPAEDPASGASTVELRLLSGKLYLKVAELGGAPEALKSVVVGPWYGLDVSTTSTGSVRAVLASSDWLVPDPNAPKDGDAWRMTIDRVKFAAFLKALIATMPGERSDEPSGVEIKSFTLALPKDGDARFGDIAVSLHRTGDASAEADVDATIAVPEIEVDGTVAIEAPPDPKGIEELIFGLMFGALAGMEGSASGTIDLTPQPAVGTPSRADVIAVMRALRSAKEADGVYPPSLEALALEGSASLTFGGGAWTYELGADGTFDLTVSYSDGPGHFGYIGFDEEDFLPESDSFFDDKDGLSKFDEFAYGTDDGKADTDGDGFNDGDEVKNGYDPNGPGSL